MPGGPGFKSRHRDAGRDQQVEALHELAHQRAQHTPLQMQSLHVERRQCAAELGLRSKVRIDQGLLF